jgi:hypothetical protein
VHCTVVRSFAILAMSLWACTVGQAQSANDEVRLRATVQAVVPLAGFSGKATPVDVDPRFALTVRIESAIPAVANFTTGAVVTLAIHSPSRLFAGGPTKGKTYDFLLRRKIVDAKLEFFGLRVESRPTPHLPVSSKDRKRSYCLPAAGYIW